MNDVLTQVKRLKENAKANRDFGDFKIALKDLGQAIEALESADHEAGEDDYKANLYRELADCYGMMGGIYRRIANKKDFKRNLEKSAAMYDMGLKYEIKVGDDSYNLSNSVVIRIMLDPRNLETQRDRIQNGLEKVQEQVKGKRKDQWWAWADLGLFNLLSGHKDAALDAYRQFGRLGARTQDYKSTSQVLIDLCESLQKSELITAQSVAQLIEEAIQILKDGKAK